MLKSGADPSGAALPEPTLAYARHRAQHDIPVTRMLRNWRLRHAGIIVRVNTILASHAADDGELNLAIEMCSAWAFAYVDARGDRLPATPRPIPGHLVGGGLDQQHRSATVSAA